MTFYQKKHAIKRLRSPILLLTQARPPCSSPSSLLREMAKLPVPGLQRVASGGCRIAHYLTSPTYHHRSPTMRGVRELGAEPGVRSSDLPWMGNVKRPMPLAGLLITVHFPSAVHMSWLSSNTSSLGQVACLWIPAIRIGLKMPQHVVQDSNKLPPKKGWQNAKITHQLQPGERCTQSHLELAARGPL